MVSGGRILPRCLLRNADEIFYRAQWEISPADTHLALRLPQMGALRWPIIPAAMPPHHEWLVRKSWEAEDAVWDDFVEKCPGGHHEQTSLWGSLKHATGGWKPLRYIAEQEGRIVGGFQMLTRSVGRIGRIGYVCKGPIGSCDDSRWRAAMAHLLKQAGGELNLAHLVVDLPYCGESQARCLDENGFLRQPENLPPSGLMTATMMVDLSAEEQTLFARLRQSTRRNVRRGERAGMRLVSGNGGDVDLFRDLMWQLCARRGTAPTPPQREFFGHLWRIFSPRNAVRIFFVKRGEEVVSAALVFAFGKIARCWKVGWSGKHAGEGPNELMWWELIRWAKREGFRHLDFVWVDRACAEAALAGRSLPLNQATGMAAFKLGFGGHLYLLPEPRCHPFNPLIRFLLRVNGVLRQS